MKALIQSSPANASVLAKIKICSLGIIFQRYHNRADKTGSKLMANSLSNVIQILLVIHTIISTYAN